MKPWVMRGKVIHGHGRGGTQLGYPTANIQLNDEAIAFLQPFKNLVLYGWGCVEPPATAKAATGEEAVVESPISDGYGPFPYAMSVGYNPQFKDVALSAEVHFLHKFRHDFYDYHIRILTVGSIREQSAFTTLEELIKTIDSDVEITKQKLATPELERYRSDLFVQPYPIGGEGKEKVHHTTTFCCYLSQLSS